MSYIKKYLGIELSVKLDDGSAMGYNLVGRGYGTRTEMSKGLRDALRQFERDLDSTAAYSQAENYRKNLQRAQSDLSVFEDQAKEPFKSEQELGEKLTRLAEVERILKERADEKAGNGKAAADEVEADDAPQTSRRQGRAAGTTLSAIRQVFAERFGNLSRSLDKMIARGEKGLRGGLVFVQAEADLARAFAEKTGRTLEQARAALQLSKRGEDWYRSNAELEKVYREVMLERGTPEDQISESEVKALADAASVFLSAQSEGAFRYDPTSPSARAIYNRSRQSAANPRRGSGRIRAYEEPLGPFSGYSVKQREQDGVLILEFFGKEQLAEGLNDSPFLFVGITPTGELAINGPISSSKTYDYYAALGWAESAKDKDGNLVPMPFDRTTYYTRFKGEQDSLGRRDIFKILGEAHARAKEHSGEAYVGIHWKRDTGATGGPMGREGAIFFSQNGQIQGLFDPQSGLTFLVGDNLDADTAPGVVLHEVTHGAQREAVNQAAANILNNPQRLPQRARGVIATVRGRMQSAGAMDADGNIIDIDEAPTYLVEVVANHGRENGFSAIDGAFMDWVDRTFGQKIGNLMRDFVAMVRAGLRRLRVPVQLTVDDIMAMARYDMKRAADGRVREDGEVVSGSFAGRNARTANADRLARAEQMETDGADARTIWRETGWYKDVDGKWRFWINDNAASIKEIGRSTGVVSDFLDHPALFDAYPEIRDIPIVLYIDPSEKTASGEYQPFVDRSDEGLFDLSEQITVTAPSADRALSVLLHEVQHVIQAIEGFAIGGSPAEMRLTSDIEELIGGDKRNRSRYERLLANIAQAVERGDTRRANRYQEDVNRLVRGLAYSAYKRLAGEAEARNTEARFGMDSAAFPDDTNDTPREQRIVRFDGGVAAMTGSVDSNKGELKRLIDQFIAEIDGRDLTSEQAGIAAVMSGEKSSAAVRKSDLASVRDFVVLNTGGRKAGAIHILLKHFSGKQGRVTAQEILDLGIVIRRGELTTDGSKRIYTLNKDGVRFRAVVGKNGKKETLITFYSDRRSQGRSHSASTGISPIPDRPADTNSIGQPTTEDKRPDWLKREQAGDKPKFSRAAPAQSPDPNDDSRLFDNLNEARESTVKSLKESLKSAWDKTYGARLGALTLRQLAEVSEGRVPQIKGMVKAVQTMQTERNKMADAAAKLAERWQKLGKQASDKLAEMMHAATAAGVDPDKPYKAIIDVVQAQGRIEQIQRLMAGAPGTAGKQREAWNVEIKELKIKIGQEMNRKKAHKELMPQWGALPDEAKEIYREARDSYVEMSKRTEQAIIDRIEQAELAERYPAAGHIDQRHVTLPPICGIVSLQATQTEFNRAQKLQRGLFPGQN